MGLPNSERSPRERESFNSNFRFIRGEAPDACESLGYQALKPWLLATGVELINEGVAKPARPAGRPGADVSYVRKDFDDSSWRVVNVPHDYAIEGPFSQELAGETAKLPWTGVAWYRKRFFVPESDRGRRIGLEIDGAMSFSAVFVNGTLVGGWPYGYSSFCLDLSDVLDFGADNVIAIRLENPPTSSRWYPGAGLYRNLWLEKTEPVHVAHWGVFVTTPRVSEKSAQVNVDVTLENESASEVELSLSTSIHRLSSEGRPEAEIEAEAERFTLKIPAGKQALRTHSVEIKKPKLWSLTKPRRYVAVTRVELDGRLVDVVETPFGIRSIRFDADKGFFLNEEHVPLQGVCMHSDLGALGIAVHVTGIQRQLEILRAMGVNAIRTSHNPPAPELLELCDRMGLLVMDEAFDCWRRGKKTPDGLKEGDPGFRYFDYATVFDDWHERDLRALVRRDRNHPCVVMWSIGNEVIEQWYVDGWKLACRLAGIVREEDRSRPITSAFNGEQAAYSGFQTAVDVVGFNYKPEAYAPFHASNPCMPVLGSETASTLSTRGEYFFPVSDDKHHGQVNFQVSSYDLSTAPWAFTPDQEFRGLDQAPFAAGEFVWTGFDYLGEPTPYNSDSTNLLNFSKAEDRARMAEDLARLGRIEVPSRSSYFGIIDLAGFPKDRFYIYQARWRPDLRMAHILPHWNWPERVGEVTPVHVYSAGDEAELFLNGRSLGKRKRKALEYRFRWDDVVYEPGELKVVVTKGGKKWATARQRTTGSASQVRLGAERTSLRADGSDLAFVTAAICDHAGLTVPRSHVPLSFELEGPGDVIAVDNGDPTSFEPFQSLQRKTFNGLALVVVRTRREAGRITLRARAAGLTSGTLTLQSES
ncbi:MAG: beta-galactosidase GalB [Myxococcota bacterium]